MDWTIKNKLLLTPFRLGKSLCYSSCVFQLHIYNEVHELKFYIKKKMLYIHLHNEQIYGTLQVQQSATFYLIFISNQLTENEV